MNDILTIALKVNVQSFIIDSALSINLSDGPLGLIGASATGKSSFLKSIAGIQQSTKLTASFAQWSWDTKSKESNPCVYVANTHSLFEHLSVSDNLKLVIRHSMFSARKPITFDDIVSQLNLEDLLAKSASSLSGGETQRVLIARALLSGKPIVLLDEMFTAMDWRTRQYVLHLLPLWQAKYGRYFIVVSHAMQDVAQCCASACLVDGGVIQAQCSLNSALQQYFENNNEHLFSNVAVQFVQTDTAFCVHEFVLEGSEQSVFLKAGSHSLLDPKEHTKLQIDANKVSLRYPSEIKSSILNSLQGRVVKVQDQEDSSVVTLDIDGQLLFSTISKKSFHNMEIQIDAVLFAEFKA